MPAARTPVTRIELLRHARGWSQRDLADAAGVSMEAVGRAERQEHGTHPTSARTAGKVAAALGVEPDELFVSAPALRARPVDVQGGGR